MVVPPPFHAFDSPSEMPDQRPRFGCLKLAGCFCRAHTRSHGYASIRHIQYTCTIACEDTVQCGWRPPNLFWLDFKSMKIRINEIARKLSSFNQNYAQIISPLTRPVEYCTHHLHYCCYCTNRAQLYLADQLPLEPSSHPG